MTSRIRIRSTIGRMWLWELVTADGHVAAGSEPFANRDDCEADARKQNLPIVGARRVADKKARPREAGLVVECSSRGVWTWKVVDSAGKVLRASPLGFLTREECERAAEAAGAAR